mgnify:CR=1 FL=1
MVILASVVVLIPGAPLNVPFPGGVDVMLGGTVRTTVGGALDPARFQPLPIEARVRLLSDGHFRSESFGWPWDAGNTAVLEADNITLVVTSRAVSLYDRSLFYAHGVLASSSSNKTVADRKSVV